MFNACFKLSLIAALFFLIGTTGIVGYKGDPIGWIGCVVFAASLVFVVALLFYEQHMQFRSSLVLINSLDLTFKQDLRRKYFGRRYSPRERLIEQGTWLHRHSI
jgi:hypothetical protein